MSSRDRVRKTMQESRDKLNKIADENGEANYEDWAGLKGRGINADLIGPQSYYDSSNTAAKVRHTYMDQYKAENGTFAYLGGWNDGNPDNDDGEPTGDKVLTIEGNDWCRFNGGILGDTKALIGDVSDSIYIRQEGDHGICLPIEYARSPHKDKGDKWPVQDNNGTLNKKGRPCAGAKHIDYNRATNILDCYYEDLDKETLSDLYNRKDYNRQHADTARQVITKYCSHPENISNAITDDKTCEDMIDEYNADGADDSADDGADDSADDDDETDDDETDDEEDDDDEDLAAILAAREKAKAAKEKEEEEAAAEQQKLFALIALVVLLLCSSSAAAALVMFNM
mgnify:CR=1 FL=1